MDLIEFSLLHDGVYEFITYMDQTIVGIPYSDIVDGFQNSYTIPTLRIKEHNESQLSTIEKIESGILIPINPDVIDDYKKIR